MPTPPLERIRSISAVARYLIVIVAGMAAAVAVYMAWLALFYPARFDSFAARALVAVDSYTVTAPVRAMLVLTLGIGFGLLGWLLVALKQAFERFRAGEVFSTQAAALVRTAGVAGLANALYLLVTPTVMTLLLTVNNPPGHRAIAVSLSSHQLFSLLMAVLLLVVGHVLALGTALDEDNKSIV